MSIPNIKALKFNNLVALVIFSLFFAIFAFQISCNSEQKKLNNALNDIKEMRVSWSKGEFPKPLLSDQSRYGNQRDMVFVMHQYYSKLVPLDVESKSIIQNQPIWFSSNLLFFPDKNDVTQKKAQRLSSIFSEYIAVETNLYNGTTFRNAGIDPGVIQGFVQSQDQRDSDLVIKHMKLGVKYYDLISNMYVFVRGKILLNGSKITFYKESDKNEFNKMLAALKELSDQIEQLEKIIGPRREKLIHDSVSGT